MYNRHLQCLNETNKQTKKDLRVLVWHQNNNNKKKQPTSRKRWISDGQDQMQSHVSYLKNVQRLEEVSPNKSTCLGSVLYNLQCRNCQAFSWVEIIYFTFVYWWQNSSKHRKVAKSTWKPVIIPTFWSQFI